jgi:pimeloyl-ACP methyl ester carboxylesterase
VARARIRPLVEERGVEVEDRLVRYRIAGEGPPLLLIHGLSGSTRWWAPVLPALAERRCVHLVDLPGFGRNRRGQRFALAGAHRQLAAVLRGLGLDAVDVAGHSMGAAVAARLAVEEPDLVRRLALIAPAGLPAGRSLLRHTGPLLRALQLAGPRFAPVLMTDALRAGPRTVVRAGLEVLAADLGPELHRVAAPTLLLFGERDPMVPSAMARAWCAAMPAARSVVLDGAGHVPMFDRPDGLSRELMRFLDRPVTQTPAR